jgi:putative cardiolipin synthase
LQQFVADQADSEYLKALRNSSLAKKIQNNQVAFRWGQADVVYDLPEKIQQDLDQTQLHLSSQLKPYLDAIEQEIILFSPYFVPGKAGTKFLTGLVEPLIWLTVVKRKKNFLPTVFQRSLSGYIPRHPKGRNRCCDG